MKMCFLEEIIMIVVFYRFVIYDYWILLNLRVIFNFYVLLGN